MADRPERSTINYKLKDGGGDNVCICSIAQKKNSHELGL